MRRLGTNVMPRSVKAAISALEAAGDGGIGAPNGMTRLISHAPRTPRAVRWSCSSATVSRDTPRFRVDGGDGFPTKNHTGLGDVAVGDSNGIGRRTTEHDIELRGAEEKGVVPVDQGEVELISERLGKDGAELEAAEPRAQDNDSSPHDPCLLCGLDYSSTRYNT